jgi:sulfur carrier protein
MEITINQSLTEIPERSSVEELLASLFADSSKGIAVAINQTVVPKSKWAAHIILPNDKITLIKATQGG